MDGVFRSIHLSIVSQKDIYRNRINILISPKRKAYPGNKAHILGISVAIHYRKEVEVLKPVAKRTGHLAWTRHSGKFGLLLSEAHITQSTQMELTDSMPLKVNSLIETSWESAWGSPCPRTQPQTPVLSGLVKPHVWFGEQKVGACSPQPCQGVGGSCSPCPDGYTVPALCLFSWW